MKYEILNPDFSMLITDRVTVISLSAKNSPE